MDRHLWCDGLQENNYLDWNVGKVPSEKVKGPASYFPSIEKKYGKSIDFWMKEIKKVSKLAHMEQVAHLKTKFEMGHGHANALVAHFRANNK